MGVVASPTSSPILVIAGPTAVGKTSLALEVAERVGADVVVADSRQIYKGLDIGTAKPTLEEQKRVRHHVLDVLDLGEQSTSGLWYRHFEHIERETRPRGRPLVVTGGSTLYIDALLNGPSSMPPVPSELQVAIDVEMSTPGGNLRLFRELEDADPAIASTLDPTKSRRLARYVGVLRATGHPPSSLQTSSRPDLEVAVLVLFRPRVELYERINQRVDQMLSEGLLEEVEALSQRDSSDILASTIGYQELLPVLSGERRLEEGVRLVKRNSRRYAKRQMTWYRRYHSARWMDARVATVDRVLEAASPWPTNK